MRSHVTEIKATQLSPQEAEIMRLFLDNGEMQLNLYEHLDSILISQIKINQFTQGKSKDINQSILDKLYDVASDLSERGILLTSGNKFLDIVARLDAHLLKVIANKNDDNAKFEADLNDFTNEIKSFKASYKSKHPKIFDFQDYTNLVPTKSYSLLDQNKQIIKIRINSQSVLTLRHRGQDKEGYVYEVTEQKQIGQGGMATVFPVAGKIKKSAGNSVEFVKYGVDTDNLYVNKIQDLKDYEKEEKIISRTHLLPKFRRTDDKGNIFMRALPNMELFELYEKKIKIDKKNQSDGEFIVNFMQNLFLAYKQQLQDKSIIHFDIKPENIRIALEQSAKVYEIKQVNFFDFNLSALTTDPAPTSRGTLHTIAPEMLLGEGGKTSADIYSLGITLMQFVCYIENYDRTFNLKLQEFLHPLHLASEGKKNISHDELIALFKTKFDNLSQVFETALSQSDIEFKNELANLIKQMCAFDPKDRPNIEELIDQLKKLDHQSKIAKDSSYNLIYLESDKFKTDLTNIQSKYAINNINHLQEINNDVNKTITNLNNQLEKNKKLFSAFVKELGVKAFINSTNKKELQIVVNNIIDRLSDHLHRLDFIDTILQGLPDEDKSVQQLKKELNDIKGKSKKYAATLDNFVELNKRFARRIPELEKKVELLAKNLSQSHQVAVPNLLILANRIERLQKFNAAYIQFVSQQQSKINFFSRHGSSGIKKAEEHIKEFNSSFSRFTQAIKSNPADQEILTNFINSLYTTLISDIEKLQTKRVSNLTPQSYAVYLMTFAKELEKDIVALSNSGKLILLDNSQLPPLISVNEIHTFSPLKMDTESKTDKPTNYTKQT